MDLRQLMELGLLFMSGISPLRRQSDALSSILNRTIRDMICASTGFGELFDGCLHSAAQRLFECMYVCMCFYGAYDYSGLVRQVLGFSNASFNA